MRRAARMAAALAAFCAAAACLAANPIAIVCPSAATAGSAGESAFAARLADHLRRFLSMNSVSADVVDDASPAAMFAERKLVFLIMCQNPSKDALASARAFKARGGKLFSFYSHSPALANLMGVSLVGYRKSATGAYSKIAFAQAAGLPPGTPQAIVQTSANIFAAQAVPKRSRVVASWQDREGRTTAAAILASDAGWWMTHVFSGDGDAAAKAQFLAAVAGSVVPGAWNRAAWEAKRKSEMTALRAYAMAQKPRAGEIRAVWDQSGQGLYPGNWARTFALLKAARITDLFVNVAGAGFAHYPSKVLPPSQVFTSQGDQLAACLRAAAGTGVRVHAWVICFNATHGTAHRLGVFSQKGWRLKDRKTGALTEYLDPSKADLRDYLLSAASEVAANYAVHGVHLDFVRWYEGAALPKDAVATVSAFVAAARRRVKAARPAAVFSTAVFGKYPSCVAAVGQDWESWIDAGFVDWVVPMNYTEDNAKYQSFVRQQGRTPSHARRIVSGIGVTAFESRLGAKQVIDQIRLARQCNLAGVCFFDLDYALANEIFPYLTLGIF